MIFCSMNFRMRNYSFWKLFKSEDILGLEDLGNMSDIDIAVIGTKGKQSDLTKFEKLLERKIILIFITHLRKYINILKKIFLMVSLSGE